MKEKCISILTGEIDKQFNYEEIKELFDQIPNIKNIFKNKNNQDS